MISRFNQGDIIIGLYIVLSGRAFRASRTIGQQLL